MKVCVAGSRELELTPDEVWAYVEKICAKAPELLIHGDAEGIDTAAKLAAEARGIPTKAFPPKKETYGRYAPLMRNIEMAAEADIVIAIWDGKSTGTGHMVKFSKQQGLTVYVFEVNK